MPTKPRMTAPEIITDLNRPWGGFIQYALNEECSVKIITVEPGQQLSYQSHDFRSELWVVLDEAMEVVIDGETKTLHRNDYIFIPQGTKHMARGLDKPCRWLEVAFGTFDENDIKRYSDRYGRS